MMSSDSLSKRFLYLLFVVSIIAEVFAVVLMALLAGFGLIGFDGNTQISGTCPATPAYYATKYSQISFIEEISFIFSILALAVNSVVLVLMIKHVIVGRKLDEMEVFVSKCIKVSLYTLSSFSIMAAIPPFGSYLSIIVEINNCAPVSYDSAKLSAVIAIAAVLLALLLFFLVLLFFSFCNTTEEKYREVSRNHTEPNQHVKKTEEVQYFNKKHLEKEEPYKKHPEVYEKRTPQEMEKNSPPKRVANRGEDLEQTKENLYNSPPRQPSVLTYNKEVDPHPLLRPSPQRRYEPSKEPAPVLQPKPYIKQSQPRKNYISPSKAPRENEGELMFYRPRTKGLTNDEEDFSREQNRYLSRHADRPILSSGIKEVNSRERGTLDGFHAGELPRTSGNNSPTVVRGGREKSLLNSIRGRYPH